MSDVLPDNEPIGRLEEQEVLMLSSAVRSGVKSCREALAHWLDSSESAPVERTIHRVADQMMRSVAASEARPAGPASTLLVRLLLIALIEEMGRPHIVTLN